MKVPIMRTRGSGDGAIVDVLLPQLSVEHVLGLRAHGFAWVEGGLAISVLHDDRLVGMSVPVDVGCSRTMRPPVDATDGPRWVTFEIGPGTWKVWPSVHQPGVLHAYLTLVDVHTRPPWAT